MTRAAIFLLLLANTLSAETLVPVRTIPAQSIIAQEDIILKDVAGAGGLTDASQIIGMEARVALFAGRPIRPNDVGPPAVVQRNEVVQLIYEVAGLTIKTEGRALERASAGEFIRIMNLASRATITAMVDEFGIAHASP